MELPDYFQQVPRLRVQDPLARALGSAKDGVLEYRFADAVRLTGHACTTVASAYWMTVLALNHLYPASLPQRGGLTVQFREDARTGSSGVVATVVQMLTGATGSSGFKGIGGRFSRAGLIRYKPDLLLMLRFTRSDTGAAVDVDADMSPVPTSAELDGLVERLASGKITSDEEARLGQLWQQRVRRLLLEHACDPAVFIVRPVQRRWTTSRQDKGAYPTDRDSGSPS